MTDQIQRSRSTVHVLAGCTYVPSRTNVADSKLGLVGGWDESKLCGTAALDDQPHATKAQHQCDSWIQREAGRLRPHLDEFQSRRSMQQQRFLDSTMYPVPRSAPTACSANPNSTYLTTLPRLKLQLIRLGKPTKRCILPRRLGANLGSEQ